MFSLITLLIDYKYEIIQLLIRRAYMKGVGLFLITSPGNAVIVSLGPNEITNANPRGNYLPVGSEAFDTLSLFGYFAVEKGAL